MYECVLLSPGKVYTPIRLSQKDVCKHIPSPTFVGALPELNIFLVASTEGKGDPWPLLGCFHEPVKGDVMAIATERDGEETDVDVSHLMLALQALTGDQWHSSQTPSAQLVGAEFQVVDDSDCLHDAGGSVSPKRDFAAS